MLWDMVAVAYLEGSQQRRQLAMQMLQAENALVPNFQYLWRAISATAERPAVFPIRMYRGPTVDPSPLWNSRQWKSRPPGQVLEQITATPVHLHLPGSQNPAPKHSKIAMEKDHWRPQPFHRPDQPSGKTWADHYTQAANSTMQPASAPIANWHHGLCTLWLQRSKTDGPPHPPGLFLWQQQRHRLWPQDESTANKLWRTAEDLRHTI